MSKTQVFEVNPEDFSEQELSEPARILADGGIVAFPTETVYGLGVNANLPESIERLREIKRRPADKPLSVHIADLEDLNGLVPELPQLAKRLAEHYWPGPLTMIVPGSNEPIGIRFPSHPVARSLIRQSGVPILAPSANISGEPPAVDARTVLDTFDGQIDAVVDGGRVAIREASSVVRVTEDNFEMLREGILTEAMIRRTLWGKMILFVCTGNSCRSPMAEALLRDKLARRLEVDSEQLAERGYHVESAGVAAFSGGRATQHAIDTMAERGLDIQDHRSQPMTHELAEEADLIIALSPSHRSQLIQWDRSLAEKVVVIRELGVSDPVGGTLDTYRECAAEIEAAIDRVWLDRVQDD